jgi:5-methylcytosine-specific restriction enzyme subunit McrC
MSHHQLFEWEARRFDAPNAIPVREADLLMKAAQAPSARLKGKPKTFDHGRDAFTAQHLVGIVAAAGTSCEILPKVDRDAPGDAPQLRRQLVRMLAVAHDLPAADDAATSVDLQNETLLEILIARFVAMLDKALRRGMPRAYRQHQEDLPALRGTLDITRQFSTLAASPHRLACRYDEFTADIALNQILKAAVARLRQLARSRANRRALTDLALLYADVTNVPAVALAWQEVVAGRSNTSWMPLIRLARLILGDRFQNSAHGGADGFALLFDMNALFERYVEKLLGPIASAEGWLMKPQSGGNSCLHPEDGTNALFATYPDIQLLRGGCVGMIVDTKWKTLIDPTCDPKMDVKQNDIYQMMAYAQLYDCENVVLLYPHHSGLTSAMPVRHRIAAPDGRTTLTIASIDLTNHGSARHALSRLPW